MRLTTAGLSLLFVAAAPAHSDHSSPLIDSRLATPGLYVTLREVEPNPRNGSRGYRLTALGFPQGVSFAVLTKRFDGHFEEVASALEATEEGNLVSHADRQLQRLDNMVLQPGPYPRGATWEVAIVSVDRTLSAFAKVIPVPLEVRDRSCAVALELVSRRGMRFLVSGYGFEPEENVTIMRTYGGRSVERRQRVAADGRLRPQVIVHASVDSDRTAHYSVKGRSCDVHVDYEWGQRALIPH
jgi:hypothetical protein